MSEYRLTGMTTLHYVSTASGAIVTGYSGEIPSAFALPDALNGVPLYGVGDGAFQGCANLMTLALPDSVELLGDAAFKNCPFLARLALSANLRVIGESCFAGDMQLTAVVLPGGVQAIGTGAFPISATLYGAPGSFAQRWAPEHGRPFIPLQGGDAENAGDPAAAEIADAVSDEILDLEPLAPLQESDELIWRQTREGAVVYGVTAHENLPVDYNLPGTLGASAAPVVRVGEGAFKNSVLLRSITLPPGLRVVENHAFAYCAALERVVFPDSLREIGSLAFVGCRSLKRALLPPDVNVGAFAFPEGVVTEDSLLWEEREDGIVITGVVESFRASMTNVVVPGEYNGKPVVSVGIGAFEDIASLKSARLPDSLLSIASKAFRGCKNLKTVNFPNKLERILKEAFSGCKSLETAALPDSVRFIGKSAFEGCERLSGLKLPANITELRANAFKGCSNLAAALMSDSLATIPLDAFDDNTAVIRLKVKSFQNLYASGSRFFPANELFRVTEKNLQYYITGIKRNLRKSVISVLIPSTFCGNKIVGIDTIAFDQDGSSPSKASGDSVNDYNYETYCELLPIGLDNAEIRNRFHNLKRFSNGFTFCSSLTKVILRDGIRRIGKSVFCNDKSLLSVELPETLMSIGERSFEGCINLPCLKVPESVVFIGKGAFIRCKRLTSFVFPNEITVVLEAAFAGCQSLKSVVFPEQLDEIEDWAFTGCRSLTSIAFPEGLTHIDDYVFNECSGLVNLDLPESLTHIGVNAFKDCANVASVKLSDSIEEIGDKAFAPTTRLVVNENSQAHIWAKVYDYKFELINKE